VSFPGLKRPHGRKEFMYTIGDFLIQVKNAYMAGKKQLEYPFSNAVLSIGKILEKEGYLGKVVSSSQDGKKTVLVTLKYENKMPVLSKIKIISKPSVRRYVTRSKIRGVSEKHGIAILSTNQGMMTNKQAIKTGIGGELICKLY
jgi:small subunit ribosomal protein S8